MGLLTHNMRLKTFLIFLFFYFLFFAYITGCRSSSLYASEENTVYRIDDGFTTSGGRSADGLFSLVDVFFSFELKFEMEIEEWDRRLYAEIAGDYLSIALRNYINRIFFPMFTAAEIVKIITDKKNTLFLDGFLEYIKDNEDLNKVRIISIRNELYGWTR